MFCLLFCSIVLSQSSNNWKGKIVFNHTTLGRYPQTIYDFIPELPKPATSIDSVSFKINMWVKGGDVLPTLITSLRFSAEWQKLIEIFWEKNAGISISELTYIVKGVQHTLPQKCFIIDEQLNLHEYITNGCN